MKRSFFAICLCWILALSTMRAAAQEPVIQPLAADPTAPAEGTNDRGWETVQQLFTGDKVKIEMKDGKKLTGAKSRATGAELYIERKGKTVELKRGDMLRVWRISPPSRKKQAILGGIGAGVGLVAGFLVTFGLAAGGADEDGIVYGGLAAVTGLPAAGAVAGVLLAGNGAHKLIYTAP
jgi:hypothetical protein